jgi:hypothetical protein
MRYAFPALAIVALVLAGAAYESRTASRTDVPVIQLRSDPPARKARADKRVKHAHKPNRSSARARFSSGHGGAGGRTGAAVISTAHREDDRDGDDNGDDD